MSQKKNSITKNIIIPSQKYEELMPFYNNASLENSSKCGKYRYGHPPVPIPYLFTGFRIRDPGFFADPDPGFKSPAPGFKSPDPDQPIYKLTGM